MKSSKLILILISLLYPFQGTCQNEESIKPLKIGDTCPDFKFSNIIRWDTDEYKLSDFKGKLVILDFWATWCGSCIKAMPKLEELQAKYPEKLVIIPVTYQPMEQVDKSIASSNKLSIIKLPFVTDDTLLRNYFPHRFIPHVVIINGNGEVAAITDSENITDASIFAALSGNFENFKYKADILTRDRTKPLIAGGLGIDYPFDFGEIQYLSLFTKSIDGAAGNSGVFIVNENTMKRVVTSWPIKNLYHIAFAFEKPFAPLQGDYSFQHQSRVLIEASDSSLFYDSRVDTELITKKPLFSYELYAPIKDSLNFSAYMQQDLNRYFGSKYNIEALIAKRKVKCWVLEKTDNIERLKSKGGKQELIMSNSNDSMTAVNTPLSIIVRNLLLFSLKQLDIPFVNETGYTDLVDISINTDLTDPYSLSKVFLEYGLKLTEAERELDMIVIKDRSN